MRIAACIDNRCGLVLLHNTDDDWCWYRREMKSINHTDDNGAMFTTMNGHRITPINFCFYTLHVSKTFSFLFFLSFFLFAFVVVVVKAFEHFLSLKIYVRKSYLTLKTSSANSLCRSFKVLA